MWLVGIGSFTHIQEEAFSAQAGSQEVLVSALWDQPAVLAASPVAGRCWMGLQGRELQAGVGCWSRPFQTVAGYWRRAGAVESWLKENISI